jgi:acetyl-CoA C-acetyltransferase
MRVGVLGVGKTPHKIQHDKSLRDLAVESGRLALADAGLEPSDIQAMYVGNVGSVGFNYENSVGLMVAHHVGVVPAGAVRVEAACGTGAWALHLGCVAILSGLYDTVMVLGVEKMNDLATVEGTSIIAQAADSKEEYFSGLTFPSGVALSARKYMQTYGLTEEDLAHTSVKNHHYGARNPYAHLRFECTVEDVMRSAKVADPLKLYEVCPMTDASSALVLCREEILRDQPDKPQVYVTATQMATGTWYAATDTLDEKVAVNLSGGLLCKGHPLGATGTTQAVDIVEQLRGTAPADMQRKDAEIGISACRGGPGAVGAIHIYQRLEG